MATVEAFISKVADILQDNCQDAPYVRWSQDSLLTYLNEGMGRLLALRPDEFTTVTDITLSAGSRQVLSDDYHRLIRIEGGPEGSNVNDTQITEANYDLMKHFRKKPCLSAVASSDCSNYQIESFSNNPDAPKHFTVSPPVPEGQTPKVTATVIKKPATLAVTDSLGVSPEYEGPLTDWVLMRAWQTDTESPGSIRQAAAHEQSFYVQLDRGYRQDQRVHSGYHLGMEGDGDPGFRSR